MPNLEDLRERKAMTMNKDEDRQPKGVPMWVPFAIAGAIYIVSIIAGVWS